MNFKFLKSAFIIAFCILLSSCTANDGESSITSGGQQSGGLSSNISSDTEQKVSPTNISVVKEHNLPDVDLNDGKFSHKKFYDTVSGKSMPYRLYVPEKLTASTKPPIILFLHGAGEIGSDNNKQLNNFSQGFSVARDILRNAVIVCPQTPSDWSLYEGYTSEPDGYLGVAKRILDSTIKEYNCDKDRVYLTGLSLGSFATWNLLDSYPDTFAAVVPVCGGGGDYVTSARLNTPIWMFPGTNDGTVSFSGSQSTYSAILASGGTKVRLTALKDVDHNAWDYAYKDREMFSWMFSQNKKTHQSLEYTYINAFEVTDKNDKTVICDKDIMGKNYLSDDDTKSIELTVAADKFKTFTDNYSADKDAVYTLKLFGKKIYDFKFSAEPADRLFRIENTTTAPKFYGVYWTLHSILTFWD